MDTENPADRHRIRLLQTIGVVVVIMAVLSTAGVGWQTWRLNQQTKRLDEVIACQTRYNKAVTDRANVLSATVDAERKRSQEFAKAQDALIGGFLTNPPATPGQPTQEEQEIGLGALTRYKGAIGAYLDASQDASDARADNPPPRLDCGGRGAARVGEGQ